MDFYRIQLFIAIDVAVADLTDRFDSSDARVHENLTNILLTGVLDMDLLKQYPEFELDSLETQLKMYSSYNRRNTVAEHLKVFREMSLEMRSIYTEVEKLLSLVLISPASSCVAERSFSALRRLKTWLRSNTKQARLNHVTVTHVHRDILDEIPDDEIADQFISGCEARMRVFGHVKPKK